MCQLTYLLTVPPILFSSLSGLRTLDFLVHSILDPLALSILDPTSPEYFPSSSGHSSTDLSDLLEELFSFPDPLVGVEEFEPFADLVEPLDPPIDLVEPPVEPEQVVEPSKNKRRRKQRIQYP